MVNSDFNCIDNIIVELKKNLQNGLLNKDYSFMLKKRVVPFLIEGDSIFLALEAYDSNLIQDIEYLTRKEVKFYVFTVSEIDYLLKLLENKMYNKSIEIFDLFSKGFEDTDNKEIIEYLDKLIVDSINKNITDIHIEPYKENIRVRLRVDGKLYIKNYLPKDAYSVIITRLKILSKLDIAERRLSQDGRITFTYLDKEIDLRLSFIPTINGEKVTIRILDSNNRFDNLNKLGLSKNNLSYIYKEINKLSGMILVCGPTNSGKTTTIYSILNELNKEDINIITIEDPVEYKLYGINQIQVNNKQGLRFDNTLRNILRADPEIISIGEIRDEETTEIALRAAITGHMILSTIHTKDSISAIFRLKDLKAETYLISSALNTIINQRLVRMLCKECKKESNKYVHNKIDKHYEPVGCPKCNNGYSGRIGAFEILKINDGLRYLINNNASYDEILREAKSIGFTTMEEELLKLVRDGITSAEEIIKLI